MDFRVLSSAVPGAGKGRRPTPRVRPLRFDLPAAATPFPGKSGAHDRSGLRTRTTAAPGRDDWLPFRASNTEPIDYESVALTVLAKGHYWMR
jgi:hypothetical protein